VELFRCPTCLGLLADPEAERCPTCHTRLSRRAPIVLAGDRRSDGSVLVTKTMGRRRRRRRFGSKEAGSR